MENSKNELKTWNIKKIKRFENKKRKVEALLNLFEEDRSVPMKKKACDSLVESYSALKNELKKYVKKPEVDPCFYLTHHGLRAQLDLRNPENKVEDPLFIEDVYQLLLRSVIGHQCPYPLGWATLEQPQNISKTVLLVIKGFTKSDITSNMSKLDAILELFPHIVEIMSSNVPFATELSTLHLVTNFHVREKDTYSTVFPGGKDIKLLPLGDPRAASRLHLLLSPIQMAMESYPFPKSVFEYSKSENYVFTKDAYSPVTNDSPLFALDCEMCLTIAGINELTSVAIIDENCELIYHTLVKPDRKIVNYLTRYSGITKGMLVDVSTRLVDVQNHLRLLLPPNAILCGQSLNCDLHALRMIHPYVIDTSIIFNTSGIRGKKDSLKKLTQFYLKEEIQNNKKGHSPIEDAMATMKLVKLKLRKILQYGDACLDNGLGESEENNEIEKSECPNSYTVDEPISDENEKSSLITQTDHVILASRVKNDKDSSKISKKNGLSISKPLSNEGFFAKLSRFSKKTCLIGSKESLDHYSTDMLTDDVRKVTKSSRKKTVKSTLKKMDSHHFIVSHLDFDLSTLNEGLYDELNSLLRKVHDACTDRTMFNVLVTGVDEAKYADIKSGLFMTVLRKVTK